MTESARNGGAGFARDGRSPKGGAYGVRFDASRAVLPLFAVVLFFGVVAYALFGGAEHIEMCHNGGRAVIRRGWGPLLEGCRPQAGDRVVNLDGDAE